jgi:hypothetical protein
MLDTTTIRLRLYIGATIPRPAPPNLIDALSSLEVRNSDSGRDGFQITFTTGREALVDYNLLLTPDLEPPSRVIIAVLIGALPQVLIDGLITNHQFSPGSRPGEGTLTVTGEDISLQLDLEDRNATYENQGDSDIVSTILGRYIRYGIRPDVTTTTRRPQTNQMVPSQQSTDLAYVQALARRNGFVFYIEPTRVPGTTTAHWGRQNFTEPPQPALTLNMGPATNLESLSFSFDALGPARPDISIVEPATRLAIPIPVPTGLRPPLARRPAMPLRRTLPRTTASQDAAQATETAIATASEGVDAVSATGSLDAVRYGRVLRARRLVHVRGTGDSYDGAYYVKQVTHSIKRGEYKQSFSLSREGRGTLTPRVTP